MFHIVIFEPEIPELVNDVMSRGNPMGEALFVGDRLDADVFGASRVGMATVQALWFRADEVPVELVLNKIDLVDPLRRRRLGNRFPEALALSAQEGEGLEELRARIAERFADRFRPVRLLVPYEEGRVLTELYELGAMLYEMVCGRPPFVGDESVAIIGQHLEAPVRDQPGAREGRDAGRRNLTEWLSAALCADAGLATVGVIAIVAGSLWMVAAGGGLALR